MAHNSNSFARDEFLQYMFQEFPSVFSNSFSRELLENVVDYGVENHSASKNSLYYFFKDMLPEVEPNDLIPYIDENMLTKEVLSLVGKSKELEDNNHLGEFDIPALMNTLAGNAWYGTSPTKMHFQAGNDVITLEGYTYEPFYEDFSSTASISFNDEVLYGLDSKNVDAYKNEVYQKGKFSTLEEAISHIREQIKGKELVKISEPSKLDKKIESATNRMKECIPQGSSVKDDIVLE